MLKPAPEFFTEKSAASMVLGVGALIALGGLLPAASSADEFANKACTALIKASNTSPKFDITIDKLSTAKGPIYAYGARSPSKPHRVMKNTGADETWSVQLDTTWIDSSGFGCDAQHRVKVDLIRNNKVCKDIKFPYANGEPSNPKNSFVNQQQGGAVFTLGDLQKAFNDCQADPKCDCD